MNKPVFLRIYGTSLRVSGDATRALDALARDFAHFAAEENAPADVEIVLRAGPCADLPAGRLLFKTPRYAVRDSGARRLISYRDGESAIYDYSCERGWLFCADENRLHELAYLMMLSRLGERLDARGLHRVHALGFELSGQGGLLLLPSGGGKSSVGLALLARTGARILSDDTPLIDRDGALHPFPLRWGFRADADLSRVPAEFVRPFERRFHGPKRLVDVDFMKGRVAEKTPLRWLVLGSSGGEAARLTEAGRAGALTALASSLVVGWGVPQMAEYTLRPEALGRLAATAGSRASVAWRAARDARVLRLRLGPSPEGAADALSALK